jgi:hypothetical protein
MSGVAGHQFHADQRECGHHGAAQNQRHSLRRQRHVGMPAQSVAVTMIVRMTVRMVVAVAVIMAFRTVSAVVHRVNSNWSYCSSTAWIQKPAAQACLAINALRSGSVEFEERTLAARASHE